MYDAKLAYAPHPLQQRRIYKGDFNGAYACSAPNRVVDFFSPNWIASLKARGAVVLVAAHRASILEAMDRLLVLADGSVADVGKRGDVLQRLSGAVPQPPTQSQTPQREVA